MTGGKNAGWYLITEGKHIGETHHYFESRDGELTLCGIPVPFGNGPFTVHWPKRKRVHCEKCLRSRTGVAGPIERELRAGVYLADWGCTDEAMHMCAGAAQRLGYRSSLDAYNNNAWPDVLSDAIECAAQLNL